MRNFIFKFFFMGDYEKEKLCASYLTQLCIIQWVVWIVSLIFFPVWYLFVLFIFLSSFEMLSQIKIIIGEIKNIFEEKTNKDIEAALKNFGG